MKIPITLAALAAAGVAQISPSTMPRIGSVDERLQSFNIEMVEVTGGRFWRPYTEVGSILNAPPAPGGPVGLDPNLYMHALPWARLVLWTERSVPFFYIHRSRFLRPPIHAIVVEGA